MYNEWEVNETADGRRNVGSITCEELSKLDSSEILLIDVRDSGSYEYGHISGAINVPFDSISDCNLPENKKLVVYCRSGKTSREAVNRFVARGFDACELYGGYAQWMKYRISDMSADTAAKVEEGLRKKFSKKLFSKFAKAIVEYKLIEPEDRIAVCISGGKDSMLMAKLFQELKRHNKFPFELKFLVMDPGYSAENRELIEANAKLLNIPVTIFETNIFENVFNIEKSPCYICARMRPRPSLRRRYRNNSDGNVVRSADADYDAASRQRKFRRHAAHTSHVSYPRIGYSGMERSL